MDCDLLVVGAGVSGCSAALSALKNGVEDVLVVEKDPFVGASQSRRIDFSAADPFTEAVMRELGVDFLKKTNRSRWISPSGQDFDFDSRIPDYWFRRGCSTDSFESLAVQKIEKSGGRMLFGWEAEDLLRLSGKDAKIGFKSKGGEQKDVTANSVVCAGGLDSRWLAPLKIPHRRHSTIIASGFRGTGFELEEDIPHIVFSGEHAPGSYALLVKDPKDGMGYATFGVCEKRDGGHTDIPTFIKENPFLRDSLKSASSKGQITGTLYVGRPPARLSRGRLFLAGDSARFMDPLFHYGIRNSLLSGYFAGKCAAENLHIKDTQIPHGYEKRCAGAILKELKEASLSRRIFDRLTSGDMEEIFSLLCELKSRGIDCDELLDDPARFLPRLFPSLLKNPARLFLLRRILF